MDPTLISVLALEASVLGVGAALAALIVTGVRSLRTEIAAVGTRLGERIDGLETGLRAELAGFEARLTERLRRVASGGVTAGAEGRAGVRQDGTETVSEPRTDSLADRVHDLDCRLSRMEGAHRWLSFGMWIEGAGPLAETRRERLADRVHNLDCRLSRMEGAHLWLSPWTRTLAETPAACLADRVHNLDCRPVPHGRRPRGFPVLAARRARARAAACRLSPRGWRLPRAIPVRDRFGAGSVRAARRFGPRPILRLMMPALVSAFRRSGSSARADATSSPDLPTR